MMKPLRKRLFLWMTALLMVFAPGNAFGVSAEPQKTNLEITASEDETSHPLAVSVTIEPIDDNKAKEKKPIFVTTSSDKAVGLHLPAGKYVATTRYRTMIRKTAFEVNKESTTKLHLLVGTTGTVEISASEGEGGMNVYARHRFFRIKEGGYRREIDRCQSSPKGTCERKLPEGKYEIITQYATFRQTTTLDLKAKETKRLHIVTGYMAKVKLSSSVNRGETSVKGRHKFFPVENGKRQLQIGACFSKVNRPCSLMLPIGEYIIVSDHQHHKKETAITLEKGKNLTRNIDFTPLMLSSKGIDACALVKYEILAPSGRVLFAKVAPASEPVACLVEDGNYTLKATADDTSVETSVAIGREYEKTLDFGGEDIEGKIVGKWVTSQGMLSLEQNGTQVTGKYYGDYIGTISAQVKSDRHLEGFWMEENGNQKCQTPKNGHDYWGKFTFEFDESVCRFTGKWGYCDETPKRIWAGNAKR